MNDTRLVHAINGIDGATSVLREVLADNATRTTDAQAVESALRSIAEARWFLKDAADGMICHFGQRCPMPLGHPGPHQAVL